MAEFDDIEYKGIGDKHIVVKSDRCFRDYSPGDTIISLSDGGQASYSCPIPSFLNLTQGHPGSESNLQHSQSQGWHRSPAETGISSIAHPLSHDALTIMQQLEPPYLEDEVLSLTRYRHDAQAHENFAMLGIKCDNFGLPPSLESRPSLPTIADGKIADSRLSEISSLHLSSSLNPTGPGTSSVAEQLRELLDVIESPEWEDSMSPEQQAEHLRRATRLKRRVRSETNPRESRPPKVRKRDRRGTHDGKDRCSS
ncbi:hypothetical protein F4804DRAFT_309477 [Jackrogersella minutella]|nr:hypothetical protein F4804DRAFT_309477 [Jackrogersella minutella]